MACQDVNSGSKVRLFLVDDEPFVRRGLRFLFSEEPGWQVCGEAGTEEEALEGMLALRPDVAVVDLSLKEGDGLSLIKRLHQLCPSLKLLVFSMHDHEHFAASAFAAGAHGYVVKEDGAERVLEAIQSVLRGKRYLSERIAAKAPSLASCNSPRVGKRAP